MAENTPSATPAAPSQAERDAMEGILFVDDEENILASLRRLLRRQPYRCYFATSAEEGLRLLETEQIDLVVSDMRMPVMDGAQFLAKIRQKHPSVVRMLLTGHSDISATIDALNRGGIFRYISKPWDDAELLEIISQGLRIRKLEREKLRLLELTRMQNKKLVSFTEDLELRVKSRTEELKQTADMLDMAYQQLKDSYNSFMRIFSTVISARPHLAKSRAQLVADLALKLAVVMELPEYETQTIYFAALLMDLGKLSLPDDLLERAESRLTTSDMPIYQRYPVLGAMTLMAIPELESTAALIREHTEYVDGSGFPDKLRGNKVSRGARVIRVARDFVGFQTGLMRADRLTPENAYAAIQAGAGKRYDAFVVRTLEPLVAEFSVDAAMAHEDRTDVHNLTPGMILSRDVLNANGILLITKNFELSASVIEKLILIENMDNCKLAVFVLKSETESS